MQVQISTVCNVGLLPLDFTDGTYKNIQFLLVKHKDTESEYILLIFLS